MNVLPETPLAILIVEDEQVIRRFVRTALESAGCTVHETAALERGRIELASRRPDLLVLDLGLPDGDGMTLLAELRGWSGMPVLVLSARSDEADKVAALDAGADDFVTKPFGMDELLARLRAAVRRSAPPAEEAAAVVTEHLEIDLAARRIHRDGEEVRLTPTEWHLVEVLVRHAGRLVGQRQLLQEVWGPEYERETNYLRVYLARIRRKLEVDPSAPAHFLTEAGVGYRFEP